MSRSAPLPRSSTTIAPCSWATLATSTGSGASTKPVCAKLDGWTRSTTVAWPRASGPSKSAARVRFVVPTSTSRAPARRTISGIRTPPPISTSSPRDTATPRRPASPTASASAAALLTVTSASSAPVRAMRCASAARKRGPRRPSSRSYSSSEYPLAARIAASIASAGHGARPRFVWRITPVALRTGVNPLRIGSTKAARRMRTSVASASTPDGASPAASRARSSATTSRATTASASGSVPVGASRRTAASSRSTLGGRARSGGMCPPWRERVGVEPTAPRRAPRHWF